MAGTERATKGAPRRAGATGGGGVALVGGDALFVGRGLGCAATLAATELVSRSEGAREVQADSATLDKVQSARTAVRRETTTIP
jgi:hypothetical protein